MKTIALKKDFNLNDYRHTNPLNIKSSAIVFRINPDNYLETINLFNQHYGTEYIGKDEVYLEEGFYMLLVKADYQENHLAEFQKALMIAHIIPELKRNMNINFFLEGCKIDNSRELNNHEIIEGE